MTRTSRVTVTLAPATALAFGVVGQASAGTIKGWKSGDYSGAVLFDSTLTPTSIDFPDNVLESVQNQSGRPSKAYNTVWIWSEEVVFTFSNGYNHSNLNALNNLIDHLRR